MINLEGSCHCGGVRFALRSAHPYPLNYCYCSICRKPAGCGGYAINLGAENSTLQVQGQENIAVYRATVLDRNSGATVESPAQRIAIRTNPLPSGTVVSVWTIGIPDKSLHWSRFFY